MTTITHAYQLLIRSINAYQLIITIYSRFTSTSRILISPR